MDSKTPTHDVAVSAAPEILFVIGSLQIGGTEMHLAMLAPALARRGWAVSVFSIAGNGTLRAEIERDGVRVFVPSIAQQSGTLRAVRSLVRLAVTGFNLLTLMIKRRPAIVHCFLPEAYLVGGPLAVLARRPVRVMSRRSLNVYQQKHSLLAAVERRLHGAMTAVLGNSRPVVRQLHEEGVSEDRLGLIYNGVDVHRFAGSSSAKDVRAALGLKPEMLVLIIVGNLIPYKGHRDLIEALVGVRLPMDWRLLVVGRDDGIGDQLKAEADAAGLGDKIFFLGSRNDVPDLLMASDIGVLCSHQEGFSNAVLEGMAAGLPMIVTDVGGNSEAVADGETGIVVPPHDPARLGGAIVKLANDAPLRKQFGAAARQRATARFSLERCVENYDAFYRGLLAGRMPRTIESVRVTALKDQASI